MEIQLSDFIDLTYDMVFLIDKVGWIKYANRASEENLFYSKEEFLKMNLNEILFESDKLIEILDKIISSAEEKDQGKYQNKQIDLSIIKKEIGYQDLI
ncbi:MAG TPA: PAS domain-containing protein, partial [Spirochaetota bacterium]|nr:PAS domain-containing protein [Spirochaetota bacterium]